MMFHTTGTASFLAVLAGAMLVGGHAVDNSAGNKLRGSGRRALSVMMITDYGGSPDENFLPLGMCEGDCDSDDDCAEGLFCFQRDAGESIPGCAGPTGSRSDFCTDEKYMTDPPMIVDFGGSPDEEHVPLGLCEGDCDSDDDCGEGLYCYQRDAGDSVPGCTGPVGSRSDFCMEKIPPPPPPMISDFGGSPDEERFPLGLCEGDCDEDNDCAGELVCYQRDAGDSIPGCTGPTGSRSDFCAMPGN